MTDAQLPAVAEKPKPQIAGGGAVVALVPQTLDEAYRLADAMSRSGLMPSSFKSPEAVMVAIMAGAELGFAPFQSCQSLAVISGRPVLFGDAIPALIWSNGFKLKEWFENEAADYPDEMAAVCEITRPDGQVIAGRFSVADAKEARLWSKDGPWQTAKKRMLKMRARSFGARDGAADLLRGLFVAEEAQDIPPAADNGAGTGMVGRLQAREVNVDPDVLNVREIANAVDGQPKRRTRRTKAQIDLDGRVAAFLNLLPSDEPMPSAEYVAEKIDAPLADVIESLQRQDIEVVGAPDAGSHMENEIEAEFEAGGEDATDVGKAGEQSTPVETPGEPAPAAEPPAEPSPQTPYAVGDEVTYANGESGTIVGTMESEPEPAEEAEVDEGEPSPPTSAASPGPVDLYRMALANAGDFASVRGIVTEFRKTTAFGDMDASERIEVNRAAVERLNDPSVIGVPGVDQNVWLFSLWMATADNEAVAQRFEMLKQSGDWQAIPPERQAIIASAVHERTGAML
jgi:hypothetical protein